MPSTKAVGDGLLLRQSEAGSQWCVNKEVKVQLQEAELVGTSSSNIYFKLSSSMIKDYSS